jgi:cyclic pyranopterin phosphate synthase
MPFNGTGKRNVHELWNFTKILEEIKANYTNVEPLISPKSSTSHNFKISGYKGTFGIIPAYTRTICNDCNRIRITATGMFKNCLFDEGVFNVRDFLRNGASDDELTTLFLSIVKEKPENGFIAEANRKNNKGISESMSTIGG